MKKKYVIWIVVIAVVAGFCAWIDGNIMQGNLGRNRDRKMAAQSSVRVDQVTELQQDSLYKLCKVWGFVKYHHPQVVDGSVNWDAELFRVMPKVLEALTIDDANQILYQWLNQLPLDHSAPGEVEEAWISIQEAAGYQSLDTSWILDVDDLGKELSSYLEQLSQICIADKSNGYASFKDQEPYVYFSNEANQSLRLEDDGMKLLSLFRFWNAFEYYSPNVEITAEDWNTVLRNAIPEMLAADDYRSYVLAIAGVAAKTGDAHITIYEREQIIQNYYGTYSLPCSFKHVDGIVVDSVAEDHGAEGLMTGDVLLEIDGISLEERIRTLSGFTALPEPDKFVAKLSSSLLKTDQKQTEVKIKRDGAEKTLQVKTLERPHYFTNPYKNGLIEQDQVGYIDPSTLKKGDLEMRMSEFASAKGIIVDLRYYPSEFIPFLMGEYIIPEPRIFARLIFPNRAMPGSFYYSDMPVGAGRMKEMMGEEGSYPPYNGTVVILMDETSQSQSEYTVMALRQSPNAVVVGSPSIGADGNIVNLVLPGGVSLNFTGLGVYTPDGKPTQRVGLEPDVECHYTVEGLRDGRDELMEKALDIILK